MRTPAQDRGLDALNLLIAGIGTAYGAFIPVYLTAMAWTQTHIGLALTVATITSTLCQVPAGLLVDALGARRRRMLWIAAIIIGITPLLLAAFPRQLPVIIALSLQAAAGALLSPAISAVSLTRAGRDGFGERLGRNARYGSIGAGAGAAIMGVSSTWISQYAVFLIAASLLPFALYAIHRIGPDQPQADIIETTENPTLSATLLAPLALLRDRRILVFAACLGLFQLSSIAVLQLAAVEVTARTGARSGLVIAAFVIIPQIIVALVSPAIGTFAERHGRRLVLIASFATLPFRAAAFGLIGNPYALIGVQTLEGAGGAAFGVMMPLVAADLTRGTKHYTLCLSLLSLAATLGTALSTVLAGFTADRLGRSAAFFTLALAGLAATLLVAVAMPETKADDSKQTSGGKGPGAL